MKRRDLLSALASTTVLSQLACGRRRVPTGPIPAPPLPSSLASRFDPATGLVTPRNEDEIAEIVRFARTNNLKVRTRGSGHSVRNSIFAGRVDQGGRPRDQINLYLSELRGVVEVDPAQMRVTAQAGVNLGFDPIDPSGVSQFDNGLVKQLIDRGWALPDLGGIIHQTVGGFLSTGSAGGSVRRSIYDAVVGITLIDGSGQRREFHRPANGDPNDPFFGAVISIGLLGVVTEVTFQCEPAYHLKGREDVFKVQRADAPLKLFGDGADGLEGFLRAAEYSRVLWYPQPDVNRLQVWQAERSRTQEDQQFVREEFEFLTDFELGLARHFFELFEDLNPPDAKNGFLGDLYALSVNLIISDGDSKTFWDDWWRILPMDNGLDFTLLPTRFTELWLPLSESRDIAAALEAYFRAEGFNGTGTNACEIYAAGASPMWLSPANGRDVIRVDPFWFADYKADPAQVYFPGYWQALEAFEPTYHPVDALAINRAHKI